MQASWMPRSAARLPDGDWEAMLTRVRGEFEEMPCLRVTEEQARLLFGLPKNASGWVLSCLERDGFLDRTSQGEYVRRNTTP